MAYARTQDAAAFEAKLFATPVPEKTDSYSPVSNQDIVEAIHEQADKLGLVISGKQYWANKFNSQVTGKFNIEMPGEKELGMSIGWKNSYDKAVALGFAAGGNVLVCTNGMVIGDTTLVRKHTGSIATEINDKIIETFNKFEDEHMLLSKHMNQMKEIEMSKQAQSELIGRMHIQEDLINTQQLAVIKKEIKGDGTNNFQGETLWDAYNNVTEGFKKSSAYSYLQYHKDLHQFVAKEYSLV